MSEGAPAASVTPAMLRALYARLGLTPSDEEIAGVAPAVERLYENDRLLEARLAPDVEPLPAPRLPPS